MVPLLLLFWPDPLQKKDLKWYPKGQTLRRSDEVGVAEACHSSRNDHYRELPGLDQGCEMEAVLDLKLLD